jgi:choice-of-anchor A domain-containing protein
MTPLKTTFAGLLLVAFSGLAQANQLTLGAAQGFNVFTFGDFTEYNTDAQGKMAIGGNFAPSNGGSFTIAGTSSDAAGVYDLVVAGNFTMSNNSMGGGDAWVGGNMTWNNISMSHNAYVVGSYTNTGGGSVGGAIDTAGSYNGPSYLNHAIKTASSMPAPIDFLSARTNLDSVSTALASEAPNGTTAFDGHSTYTLTGASSTLNVFNLSASSYNSATININAPVGSTVVVNVAGTSDSFTYGSINLNGIPNSNVIFNFASATVLSLNGIGFNASILAPFATFTGTYGNINGELIAQSVAGTTQLNSDAFTGNLGGGPGGGVPETTGIASTPEPSTWLSLVTGGICLVVFRKRRVA